MRYKKKPVVIEAFRLTDDPDRIAPAWFTQAVADEKVWIDRSLVDRKSTRLNSSHVRTSRMPSSA